MLQVCLSWGVTLVSSYAISHVSSGVCSRFRLFLGAAWSAVKATLCEVSLLACQLLNLFHFLLCKTKMVIVYLGGSQLFL